MIETSLNEYLRLINEAAESKADIIVFPEGALNYNGIGSRAKLMKYAVELNETDIYNSTNFDNVCDYTKKSSVRNARVECEFCAKHHRYDNNRTSYFRYSRKYLSMRRRTKFMFSLMWSNALIAVPMKIAHCSAQIWSSTEADVLCQGIGSIAPESIRC